MNTSAYYESPNAFPAMHSYIQVLGKADEWRTLMDVVRYSDDLPTTYGHSIFVQYLTMYGLSFVFGPPCRRSGQPEFFLRAMDDVLQVLI